jgi:hypothetical protein
MHLESIPTPSGLGTTFVRPPELKGYEIAVLFEETKDGGTTYTPLPIRRYGVKIVSSDGHVTLSVVEGNPLIDERLLQRRGERFWRPCWIYTFH